MTQPGRDPLSGEERTRRRFTEPPAPRGARNVDTMERGVLTIALLGAIPGFAIGAMLGYFLRANGHPLWLAVLSALACAAFVPAVALYVTGRAGALASRLHAPPGRSTPPRREYSYAESLVARGAYEEGVTAYELAVAEDPGDPTPYLCIARAYRDHLERPEDAARWFRRALAESEASGGVAALARRELVELYMGRLEQPARAAPLIARMVEETSGTEEAAWAVRALARVRAELREREGGGGSP